MNTHFGTTGPVMIARCAEDILTTKVVEAGNKWRSTDTYEFGDSTKHNGFCTLGSRVIAVGHPDRNKLGPQGQIESAYRELRPRHPTQPRHEERYAGPVPSHAYPNKVVLTRGGPEPLLRSEACSSAGGT